jgi:ABC-type transport system substrate-binding protein
MAGSPVCGLDRSLCATALSHLVSVAPSEDGTKVVLELDEGFAPFLAEVLAQVPIVDMAAVEQAATTIVASAGDLDPHAPDKLVTSIYKAVGADQCIAAEPPKGCRLADHRADLEGILSSARVSLPAIAAFTDETGQVDEAAYANALLDRVAALGQVLTGTGTDRQAATLGLMDGLSTPLGAGPYRVTQVVPGERMELAAVPGRKGGAPIKRIRFEVVQDPAVAATRLLGGDVDWVPQLDPSLVDGIDSSGRAARAAVRPLEASWVIVFNTRDGRPYTDAPTRAAFTDCIDRAGLTRTVAGGDAILADMPLADGSWAMDPGEGQQRDVANAKRLLDMAGWTVGHDGIRVRDGHRLSSTIALRSSQVELLTMLRAVASQLRDCGIELDIEDLDVTGDQLLDQMRWPNDFDTLLTLRSTGVDPDADLIAFEGSHATSADQEIDANPGGFSSKGVDRRIAEARHTLDQHARGQLYREVQDLLASEAPAWWVWYDSGWSAIADRVRTRDGGRVDPSRPRYEHDARDWTLAARGASTGTPSPGPAAPSTAVPASPSEAP